VVHGDQVEAFARGQRHAFIAAGGGRDGVALARQNARGEAPQPLVVINIENARGWRVQASSALGIWITDRNRPSWRIASAKLS
jgi:hypothetical protein